MTDTVQEAVQALQDGKLIIVADDDNREAEGDLVGLASQASSETLNFMVTHARGLVCAPLSPKIAKKLDLGPMTQDSSDPFGTGFTVSVDHQNTTTGISAFDRAETIKQLASPKSQALDFRRPGHIFPLIAKEGGVLERRGHTEAAIDLAKLAGDRQAAYICEILKEDGSMARLPDLEQLADQWQLPLITIEDLSITLAFDSDLHVSLPTKYGDFDLTLFQDQKQKDHLLLSKGDIRQSPDPLLVRIHSECLTGDVFGSERCDCGQQLEVSMQKIQEAGRGAIIYLRQEGRGIGLKNKIKAYKLQEKGMDTYDANVHLGFKPDERDYRFAYKILQALGIQSVQLLTNNPEKIDQLEELGLEVTKRIPLEVQATGSSQSYLKTKKEKFHHLLSL
ncbi:Riboflavin biosynthesis protein ribBA [Alloiococcus otitis]|uniref:GTP cyclohydrolase-2 n=1 Tax=Alloiococcus otitis ATCC 51267 TaxID=883081 RepID=K9EA48_9LACT|nr:GTP cyclohydrolase II [Alloiococcus otitis]EKU93573.1 GTP cyclohydrolase II [Alloiococcus otitis ATCC 51267]SUU80350.1 Riboflavin biosynthesis protein ribBA [Alloiococcus otitis]